MGEETDVERWSSPRPRIYVPYGKIDYRVDLMDAKTVKEFRLLFDRRNINVSAVCGNDTKLLQDYLQFFVDFII